MSEMSDLFDRVEFIHLEHIAFTPELLRQIPAHLAHQHQVIPIDIYPNGLKIAISNPSDLDSLDTLCTELARELVVCIADVAQLRQYINKLYPLTP